MSLKGFWPCTVISHQLSLNSLLQRKVSESPIRPTCRKDYWTFLNPNLKKANNSTTPQTLSKGNRKIAFIMLYLFLVFFSAAFTLNYCYLEETILGFFLSGVRFREPVLWLVTRIALYLKVTNCYRDTVHANSSMGRRIKQIGDDWQIKQPKKMKGERIQCTEVILLRRKKPCLWRGSLLPWCQI